MSCFVIGKVLLLRLGHQGREGLDVRMTSVDVELRATQPFTCGLTILAIAALLNRLEFLSYRN
jgi:hypothetical protein